MHRQAGNRHGRDEPVDQSRPLSEQDVRDGVDRTKSRSMRPAESDEGAKRRRGGDDPCPYPLTHSLPEHGGKKAGRSSALKGLR